MKRLPSFYVFIARAGRIYKIELHIAHKRDKLLPLFKLIHAFLEAFFYKPYCNCMILSLVIVTS